jgi:hypothetical protein
MNKKIIAGFLVVVIAGVSFYGGMAYAKSSAPARGQFTNGQFMGGQNRTGGLRAAGSAGSIAFGEIVSKDATSVTVKTQDGSSKIVLVSASVKVTKSVEGSLDDLVAGENVSIVGTTNKDGSLTAQSVQIRPAGSVPTGVVRKLGQ